MLGVRVTTTSNSAVVTWRTSSPVRSRLAVGVDAPLVLYRGDRRRALRHTARLGALVPATTYRFRIDGGPARTLTTAPLPSRSTATTRGGALVVDGQPFFPLLSWQQCAAEIPRDLAVGVNVFMGGCPGTSAAASLAAVGGRAFSLLPIEERTGVDGAGLLGWNQPDEPDWATPPDALVDPAAVDTGGRVVFETLTAHFASKLGPLEFGKDAYPAYAAHADVVGFDLYPLGKFCREPTIGLADVFTEQRELARLARGKPTFQWIETGPLEGECAGVGPALDAATVRAEIWLAVAAGAKGIGYFTQTWPGGNWRRYDVDPAIEAELARTSRELDTLAPVLLRGRRLRVAATPPVRAAAYAFHGVRYLVAVNLSRADVRARVAGRAVPFPPLGVEIESVRPGGRP